MTVHGSMCKCDSLTCLQSVIRFRALHLVFQGFSSSSNVFISLSVFLFLVCQTQQKSSQSSLIMTWHAKQLWDVCVCVWVSVVSPAGFILTSFPRAPHTSWNSLNYAPSMAQRSKWHPQKKKKCGVTHYVLWKSYFPVRHQPGQDRKC